MSNFSIVCLSAFLPVCLSACLPACFSACLSVVFLSEDDEEAKGEGGSDSSGDSDDEDDSEEDSDEDSEDEEEAEVAAVEDREDDEDENDEPLSLAWPETPRKQATYLFLLPIIFPLWLTVPDVRNPVRLMQKTPQARVRFLANPTYTH